MKVYVVVTTFGIYGEFDDVRVYPDKQNAKDFIKSYQKDNPDIDYSFCIYERELY